MKVPSEGSTLKMLVAVVAMIGCLTVFNAASPSGGGDVNFAARQFAWLGAGLLLMEILSRTKFSILEMACPGLVLVSVFLLVLVLFFGARINGMRGWFRVGSFLFQPSEFAKPVFVLAISAFLSARQDSMSFVVKTVLLVLAFVGPIVLEPDYGTALVYLCVLSAFLFLRAERLLRFSLAMFFCMTLLGVLAAREDYVVRRICGYLFPFEDPYGAGWHILQFRYAIARGGPLGAGWGECLWANSYLPLPHSDSSFATLAEASGFLGTVPLMLLYAALPFIGARLAGGARKESNAYFILLCFFLMACQGYIHILVNLGVLPPTGLTLPLFSYGGSSLVATTVMVGMALSAAGGGRKTTSMEMKE